MFFLFSFQVNVVLKSILSTFIHSKHAQAKLLRRYRMNFSWESIPIIHLWRFFQDTDSELEKHFSSFNPATDETREFKKLLRLRQRERPLKV